MSLYNYLAKAPNDTNSGSEVLLDKLDAMMAEVAVLQETAGWTDLIGRAEEIRHENMPDRRRLLYDGLMIDCGQRLRKAREFNL